MPAMAFQARAVQNRGFSSCQNAGFGGWERGKAGGEGLFLF